GDFFRRAGYNREAVLRFAEVARGRRADPWPVRRLAILMLENKILKLSVDNLSEFDFLFTEVLRIKDDQGLGEAVIKEGYSNNEFGPFIIEFHRRLARLNRIHRKMSNSRISEAGLRDFINLSGRDCKLSLARYFFTDQEVIDQIARRIRASAGLNAIDEQERSYL